MGKSITIRNSKTGKDEVWDIPRIKNAILTSDIACCRALVRIYNAQTSSEKASETTQLNNGVGFNSADAEFLSSVAKSYLQYGSLFPEQLYYVRISLPKYAGQILDQMIAESRNQHQNL